MKYFYTFRCTQGYRDNDSIFIFRHASWDAAHRYLKMLSDESRVYKYKLLVTKRYL